MRTDVITHYDLLIDENNDPVEDPKPLREYMNQWDGAVLTDALGLDPTKSVLEIGVGTSRLAVQVAPLCKQFTGIDLSPKTIARAKEHLKDRKNVTLLCGDYLTFDFGASFDVIYSSLTWMHFQDKRAAMRKTAGLLRDEGRFVLSVSKEQDDTIYFGTREIQIFPDDPGEIKSQLDISGLRLLQMTETEKAYIFIAEKR